MKAKKAAREKTRSAHRQSQELKTSRTRLVSLLTCSALVGSTAYLTSGDVRAAFGDAIDQNELPGPVKEIQVEMHEGTNMAVSPSPDGTRIAMTLQGGIWI